MYEREIHFQNRREAGRKLGEKIKKENFENPLILALPRGGVPVASEVSQMLGVGLDVIIARKIGAPGHPEFGIGAISEESTTLFNPGAEYQFDLEGPEVKSIISEEEEELRRRLTHYRRGRKLPSLAKRTVILIDDGLATGATAAVAGKFLRTKSPLRLILAVPVCPQDINPRIREIFDEIICLKSPPNFRAVGLWYDDFTQVEDEEVLGILERKNPQEMNPNP